MTGLTLAPHAEYGGLAQVVSVGLLSAEAQRRLTDFGPNEIRHKQPTNALTLLARQFRSPVIWLLLVASALSATLGEWQFREPALGVLALIEKWRVDAETRPTPSPQKERTNGGVRVQRRS